MAYSNQQIVTGPVRPYDDRPGRRSLWQALGLYLRDANKTHLVRVARVILLILAGYAPFAALNDALAPFAFGIPLLDDLEVPLGIIAAIKMAIDIRKYRSYNYRP